MNVLNGTKESLLPIAMLLVPAGVILMEKGQTMDGVILVLAGLIVIGIRAWVKTKCKY